ncbi:YkyB family protein, partial [Litchfieldia salsa]
PRNSQQQSDVLVSAGDYYFHMPPSKEDIEQLPHLGDLNETYRNPKTQLSLSTAKNLLQHYVGLTENPQQPVKTTTKNYKKPVFKKLGQSYF